MASRSNTTIDLEWEFQVRIPTYAENIRYNYRDNGYPVWQAPA
ncbi:hypothetical protein FOMG_17630 [Fusarium oxysporum f. sp. melonis 26406]|uniref:Uncharacterized protein n=1 Tax=Fusarium oxysporum f. sp. melonis 26406 TaxID=1089452 RepID=W9Z1R1_FUSOX|nr:hypothetical protein FOMG_17630 [Fusarium oxysporum f. sp. melonis 26406]